MLSKYRTTAEVDSEGEEVKSFPDMSQYVKTDELSTGIISLIAW